jgi:hypothetical protein
MHPESKTGPVSAVNGWSPSTFSQIVSKRSQKVRTAAGSPTWSTSGNIFESPSKRSGCPDMRPERNAIIENFRIYTPARFSRSTRSLGASSRSASRCGVSWLDTARNCALPSLSIGKVIVSRCMRAFVTSLALPCFSDRTLATFCTSRCTVTAGAPSGNGSCFMSETSLSAATACKRSASLLAAPSTRAIGMRSGAHWAKYAISASAAWHCATASEMARSKVAATLLGYPTPRGAALMRLAAFLAKSPNCICVRLQYAAAWSRASGRLPRASASVFAPAASLRAARL